MIDFSPNSSPWLHIIANALAALTIAPLPLTQQLRIAVETPATYRFAESVSRGAVGSGNYEGVGTGIRRCVEFGSEFV